jgi:hypothetical protein
VTECVIESFSLTAADIEAVRMESTTFEMTELDQTTAEGVVCQYEISYSATLSDGTSLPEWI